MTFRGAELAAVDLYPVELGFGRRRGERGRPILAANPAAVGILAELDRLTRPFGARVLVEGDVGRLAWAD